MRLLRAGRPRDAAIVYGAARAAGAAQWGLDEGGYDELGRRLGDALGDEEVAALALRGESSRVSEFVALVLK